MHRRHISHWGYFDGGNMLAPVNRRNNVDYMTSSCVDWCIKEEHLYAVNKLAVFDHVESISIEWRRLADPIVLNALAQKMPVNSSIDRISICDESATNFINFPAEPIEVRLEVVDGLINVLGALTIRHHPLIQLDIELPFHPSLHQSLVELLTTHTSLKHLSLKMIHMPAEVFKNIIKILVTSHKSLKSLKFANVTNATDEIVDLAIEAIKKLNLKRFYILLDVPKDDNRLMELEMLGYIVTIYGENETKCVDISRKKDQNLWPPNPISPTITNDEHQTNVIQTLPNDILQYILNILDIKSLLRFKCTNRLIQSWFQTSSFWRQYYLSKARAITTEIMTAADLIYGSYIDRNSSVDFWQCISMAFAGSLLRRDVATCYSLNAFHEQLLEKLVHAYPELRMMESIWRRMSIYGKWKYYPKKNWFPSRLSFYLLGSSQVVYHLNVDMTRPDAVGIRFFHGEVSRAEEESNPSPKAIYDYFVSSSINEVISRVKPMVESMTVSMRSAHSYIYRHLPLQNIIDCDAIPDVHKKCMKLIETTFDSYSKALLDKLQLKYDHYDAFKNVIEQFSDHVSNVTIDHVTPDYAVIHHQVNQTAYNKLYQMSNEQGQVGYWNFEHSFLDVTVNQQEDTKKASKQVNSKDREKKIPHVALLCLFRKVLNLIMMPVLKSLWLRNLNDIHAEWYSFDKPWGNNDHKSTPLVSWYDYYCNKWQPLSSISVSRANPSSWPMSAIVVGSRLAPFICEAVVAQVRHKWNGSKSEDTNTKIDALIQAIGQYNLFPKALPEVIKKVLQ